MKKVVLKVAVLALVTAVPFFAKKTEESSQQSFDASVFKEVKVDNINGKITTSVSSDNTISVSFTKLIQHPAGKEVDLDDIVIEINENSANRTLEISVDLPDRNLAKISFGCDIELALPRDLYLDATTINGEITATGHQAGLKLSTVNGSIKISETSGDAKFSSANGAITVDNHSGNLTGEAVNGLISAVVNISDKDGICRLSNVNGSIKVSIPKTAGAQLTMSTVHGGISIDGKKTKSGILGQSETHQILGEGSGTIELSTVNGAISLNRN